MRKRGKTRTTKIKKQINYSTEKFRKDQFVPRPKQCQNTAKILPKNGIKNERTGSSSTNRGEKSDASIRMKRIGRHDIGVPACFSGSIQD